MKKVDYEHFGRFLYPCNLETRNGDFYYTIKQADFEDNRYKSDLYLLRGGKERRLTASGDVSSYRLRDDGIYFTAVRNEKDKEAVKNGRPLTVLYRLPYDGGEAQEVLRLDMQVSEFQFVDNDRFFFTADYSHAFAKAMVDNENDLEKAAKAIKEDSDYFVFDELPYWGNGLGVVNKVRNRLYFYDKGAITPLVDELTGVYLTALSPDKKTLIFSANTYADVDPLYANLFCVHADKLKVEDISIEEQMLYHNAAFLDNNDLVIFASDCKSFGVNQNTQIFRCNLKTHKLTCLYDKGAHATYGSVGSEVRMGRANESETVVYGKQLYSIDTLDDSAHIISIDVDTGEIKPVTKERGILCEFVAYEGGFAAFAMRGLGGCELYRIDLDGNEKQLTTMNAPICAEYESSTPIDVYFQNENDVTIHGWVIPPVGMKKGKKYPTILDIHGGPKTVFGNVYFHEMQLWAGMGYAVIYCNPTGGDGKGDTFADIRGKYGTTDFRDIMTFCDRCIEQFSFIDATRMGVTGGSYGGFMTNWIIGHTDRFKAAATQRSIANWTSFSMLSDIGPFFTKDQCGLLVWDDLDLLWEQSPLKYADKVTTPTLVIHSDEDYRCPMAEGLQMFSALRYHGVPTRLVLFKGENHELSRSGKPKHRVRRLKEITEWFEKYLKA